MRVKGGFARFHAFQHGPNMLGNFPDNTETFPDHPDSLKIIWSHFLIIQTPLGSSGNFPDHPGTFLDHPDSFLIIWTHF